MRKLFLSAVCLAVIACSCTENEGLNISSNERALTINAQIGNSVSRAEKLAWETGDKVGIYVCEGTIDKPYNSSEQYANALFTFTGKGFKSETLLLDEREGTVYGYYPYVENLADPKALPVDITTQTDHLWGEADTKVSIISRNANINMQHALTQVIFKIKKTDKYEDVGVLTAVTLSNMNSSTPIQKQGTLNITDGSITTTQPGNIDFEANVTLTSEYVSLSSIVIPVPATTGKDMKVEFTIDGKPFHYAFPAGTTWKAGYRNIYAISLDNNGLIIGGGEDGNPDGSNGVIIEPWVDTPDENISLVPVI